MFGQILVAQDQFRGITLEDKSAQLTAISQRDQGGFEFRQDRFGRLKNLLQQLSPSVFATDAGQVRAESASKTLARMTAGALRDAREDLLAAFGIPGQRQ